MNPTDALKILESVTYLGQREKSVVNSWECNMQKMKSWELRMKLHKWKEYGISQILVKKPFSLQPICGWNVCQYTDLQGIYDYKIHPEVKSVICYIEQQLDQEIQVRKWKQKGYG